jgi:hypothetical protein
MKSKKFFVNCAHCCKENIKQIYYTKHKPGKNYFCNRICKTNYQKNKTAEELLGKEKASEFKEKLSKLNLGKNNPNYGNKLSLEQRQNMSKIKKKYYENNPSAKWVCGSSNRGIKFSKERIEKCHGHRLKSSYSRPMKEHTKKIIGQYSKERMNSIEYKKIIREKMENAGYWIPLDQKNFYDLYNKEANWICSMYKFVHVNNAIKNKVRDHIIPRWVGYQLNVYPEILRHPINCQIISRSENTKKGFTDKQLNLDYWIKKLDELIFLIQNYDNYWIEQNTALICCNNYKNNIKYNLENLKRKYNE